MVKINKKIIEDSLPAFNAWIYSGLKQCQELLSYWDDDTEISAKNLYIICHNIKGTCGTFDYQLLSNIGSLLCIYICDKPIIDISVSILQELIDTMYVIIDNGIYGDGGEIGRDIINQLTIIIM